MIPLIKHNYFPAAVLVFFEIQGLLSFFGLFSTPSEQENAVLFGLSTARLFIAGLFLLLLILNGGLIYWSITSPDGLARSVTSVSKKGGANFYPACLSIFGFLVILTGVSFFIFYTPAIASKLEMMPVVFKHIQYLVLWSGLVALQLFAWLLYSKRQQLAASWQKTRWLILAILSFGAGLAIIAAYGAVLYFQVEHVRSVVQFRLVTGFLLTGVCFLLSWSGYKAENDAAELAVKHKFRLLFIFLAFLLIYKATAISVNHVNTPSKSYFDQLAYAFLEGRLYLENPSSTMDLTLYQDQWYVAFPPLAALLMVPLAWHFGAVGFSTVSFSIFFAALNVMLVFEMLHLLAQRGWTKLRAIDNAWLMVLFGLGTIHWYMSIVGRVWYISRLLALTFMLLAAVLALKRKSPWFIGLCVGLAVLARPNLVFIWPFFLAIYWQGLADDHAFEFKKLVYWTFANAVPIMAGTLALLWYNNLRFDNWFDFGYATMNVGVNTETLQKFGQFHPAFIGFNLRSMWLNLPYISQDCANKLVPNPQGISLLITTPPIIYLLGAIKRKVWLAGAWAAVLLQIALLSLHTGYAWEFGYRFFMDFIIPVMALIALGAGTRVTWLMKLLIMAGVVVNLWGVLWIFDLWCAY